MTSKSWELSPAELRAGLAEIGREYLVGMKPEHLSSGEATGPAPDSEDLAELVAVAANPAQLVHAHRGTAEDPDMQQWYYCAGNAITHIALIDGSFHIRAVPDETTLIHEVLSLMPLRVAPDAVHYQAVVDEDDLFELRALAEDLGEVPAVSVLEADGMQSAAAKHLVDAAYNPEWRARAIFSVVDGQSIVEEHPLLVLQGASVGWFAIPIRTGSQTLLIQSAQAGVLEHITGAFWREIRR